MQDEEGQIVEAHSISAGLDYPGTGPQHAHLRDSGRARYVAVTDARRARARSARSRGSRASSPRSRPRTRWPGCCAARRTASCDLVCLSGRGDKDLAEVLAKDDALSVAERDGGATHREALRPGPGVARFAGRAAKRAALMPYLMGGFPTLAESARIGEAYVRAGADVIELGVPYSDPLADGPVIHAAGTRALAAGANVGGVLEVARALAPSVPVVLMCYANMVFAPGVEAFVERLARTGACGLIVPDLPYGEAPEVLEACERRGLALVPLVAPTTPPERLARDRRAGAGLPLHGLGRRHDRRAARARRALRRGRRARQGRDRGAGRARLRHRHARAGRRGGRRGRRRRDRRHAAGAGGGRVRGPGRGGRARSSPRSPRACRRPRPRR